MIWCTIVHDQSIRKQHKNKPNRTDFNKVYRDYRVYTIREIVAAKSSNYPDLVGWMDLIDYCGLHTHAVVCSPLPTNSIIQINSYSFTQINDLPIR